MSGQHASLAPSAAHRWMHCVGSPHLEATRPDTSSDYANEGTVAHFLASTCLKQDKPASAFIGRDVAMWQHTESNSYGTDFTDSIGASAGMEVDITYTLRIDQEMADYVQIYIDAVLDYAAGNELFIEQSLSIEHVTKEEGAKGTSDDVIVAGSQLQVHDLKYGRGVQVYAEDNEQLLMYAVGAAKAFSLIDDFETVRLVIHQPRLGHLSEVVYPIQRLTEFAQEAAAAAKRSHEAKKEISGMPIARLADHLHKRDYLKADTETCRFCRAQAICPAAAELVQTATAADFVAETPPAAPSTYTPGVEDDGLSAKMKLIDFIESWCKAVRAEVETRLVQGIPVPGFKLVEGRRGNRQWDDEAVVEAQMKKLRISQSEMYSFKLISPPQAEKLLKNKKKHWEKISQHIVQGEGKPSVAPEDDKRPAIVTQATTDDFSDVTDEDSLV